MEAFCPGLEMIQIRRRVFSAREKPFSGVWLGYTSLQASGGSISELYCMLCQGFGYLEEEHGLSHKPDRGVSVVERYT